MSGQWRQKRNRCPSLSFSADAKLWNPDKVVLVADYFIHINNIRPDLGAVSMHQYFATGGSVAAGARYAAN